MLVHGWLVAVRVATLSTVLGGGYLGAAGLRERDWARTVGGAAILMLGALAAALILVRHWLARHDAKMQRDLGTLAEERRAIEVAKRRLEREAHTTQLRIESAQARLDQTLNDLWAERRLRLAAQKELRELTEDHNLLIQETLQTSADLFARRHRDRGAAAVRRLTRVPDAAARGEHDRI